MKKLALALTAWLLAASVASAQVITGTVPNTFINGTIIDATQVNADYTYIINQVNANAAKNGVNSDISALTALATPLTPVQSGSNIYYAGFSTGTANAQIVTTATPANFTLAYGKTIRFLPGFTNTGPTTIAVNGTVATAIVKQTPAGIAPLTGGEIAGGDLSELFFDGAQFEILNASAENGGFGALTGLAGSATPDLGTVPSHNINLTAGPFTITSLGSSASATYPMYFVRFNATNTLVNGASLNLLGGVNRLTAGADEGLYLYNGAGVWYELAYFPASSGKFAPTSASALTIHNNAVTPTTIIDVAATETVMDNPAGGNYYTENYGTCSINMSITGLGGLDSGVIAANTWYNIFAISNGSANSCLASLSATAPVMPGGYVFKTRLGATRTSSGAPTLWPIYQQGNVSQFSADPAVFADQSVASGIQGTCGAPPLTMTASSTVWGALIPSTASTVNVTVSGASGQAGKACVGTYNNTGNPPVNAVCATTTASANENITAASFRYAGVATLFYCGSINTSRILTTGWVDHVNAN
jgi:hypothetical protein